MTVATQEKRTDLQLAWIKTSQMAIAGQYQREANAAQIQRLIDGWDDLAVGVLYVTLRGRTYYIMDGQHRWMAAQKLEVRELPCLVYSNLTDREQARLFVMFNRQRRIAHTVDVFRASIAQGDENALIINRILKKQGYTLGTGKPYFGAVSTARYILDTFGGDVLSAILSTTKRAWGHNKIYDAGNSNLLRAITQIYSHYSATKIDWDLLVTALSRTSLIDLTSQANARRRRASDHKMPALMAQVLIGYYNDSVGRQYQKRLSPVTELALYRAGREYRHDDI